ncbi:hypothetical protein BH11MYX1_BH11MYX1_34360 [soil metagenome]
MVACGGDSGTKTPDSAVGSAAARITVSGTAKAQGISATPLAGVTIGAYRNGNETTAVATTITDQQGAYTMDIETGGVALDGYIKATITSYLDTYLYPPSPLAADFAGAAINILNTQTIGLVGQLCGLPPNTIMDTDGIIAVEVVDGTNTAVAGAVVASTPAAAHYCYNGANGLPSTAATMTATDGVAYMIQVTGASTSVTATKSGATFNAHTVNSRAGAFTTTIIAGQ